MPLLDALARHYPWVLVLCGVAGVALGIDRTVKRRERESLVLQSLSAVSGLVVLTLPTVMVLHLKPKGVYTPATLLLMIVLSLCLLARPLKRIPIAFTVVTAAGVFLLWAAIRFHATALGRRTPIELVILVILVLLAALCVLSFMLETIVDTVLFVLGLGLVVTLASAIALLHGTLIATGMTGIDGFLRFLR